MISCSPLDDSLEILRGRILRGRTAAAFNNGVLLARATGEPPNLVGGRWQLRRCIAHGANQRHSPIPTAFGVHPVPSCISPGGQLARKRLSKGSAGDSTRGGAPQVPVAPESLIHETSIWKGFATKDAICSCQRGKGAFLDARAAAATHFLKQLGVIVEREETKSSRGHFL